MLGALVGSPYRHGPTSMSVGNLGVSGADTGFCEGGGGGDGQGGPLRGGGGVIAPVGEKLLFEHTKFSATREGGDHPYPPPLDPPLGLIYLTCLYRNIPPC